MKIIITLIFVVFSSLGFTQDEIKMPELDTENKVYVLKFSPDSKEKNVISAYMKGTTEPDSLRFWAEGTHIPQNVMVTVLSRDKTKKIKVDIVKDHWEDVKRGGTTEDGIYQESFDTAGKFGIVISSDFQKVPFDLAVWTSGEILPSYASLYVPISNEGNSNSAQNNYKDTSNFGSNTTKTNGTNYLLYTIIGLLALIAAILALKMFKNKGKAILIVIVFLSSQQMLYPQATQSLSEVFTQQLDNSNMHPGVTDIGNYSAQIGMLASQDWSFDYLAPVSDGDAQPQMDDGAGPRLPSSCIPDRYRQENSRINNDSTDPAEIISGGPPTDNNGNNRIGDDFNSSETSEDTSSDTEEEYSIKDQKGRPKYDKKGNPINYDDSKYPKYNKDGKKIEYGDIKEEGDFDSKGRPKYDVKGDPIKYDNADRPKYDAKGNPIDYGSNSGSKDDPIKIKEAIKAGKSNKNVLKDDAKEKTTSISGVKLALTFSIDEINELKVYKNITKSIQIQSEISQASILNIPALFIQNNNTDQREEGCKCLEDVYEELNTRRLTLEKLRIIFSHSMKKINAGMAFGDNVSGVHGVSGLAWQSQKMIILKESIPTLNKAYDDKYAELIENLQKNLWEIDRCEKLLGYDDWYNHSGFIYYAFMRDKYSRN